MTGPRPGRTRRVIPLLFAAFGLTGCGDDSGGGIDVEAAKRASAAGGLKFPGPDESSEGPPASPALRVPKE